MAKITYDNKVALNDNPNIADINKVKDTDMNEIKSVVNINDDNLSNLQTQVDGMIVNNDTTSNTKAYSTTYINNCNLYSTNETYTGKTWINGKPIYRKVLVLTNAVLISSSWTTVASISGVNIDALIKIETLDSNNIYWAGTISKISGTNLQLFNIGANGTDWYVKTLILEYTKTTD